MPKVITSIYYCKVSLTRILTVNTIERWDGSTPNRLTRRSVHSKRVRLTAVRGKRASIGLKHLSIYVDGEFVFSCQPKAIVGVPPVAMLFLETTAGHLQGMWCYQIGPSPISLRSLAHAVRTWITQCWAGQPTARFNKPDSQTLPTVWFSTDLSIKTHEHWSTLYAPDPVLIDRQHCMHLGTSVLTDSQQRNKRRLALFNGLYTQLKESGLNLQFTPIRM